MDLESPSKNVELILELPAHDSTEADFPEADELPRSGSVGRVLGLDGQQVLQLGVIVSASSVQLLGTWLLARAERLRGTRVVWEGREFNGYSPEEIELIVRLLKRELDGDPGDVTD
jgi:hypothetical protein